MAERVNRAQVEDIAVGQRWRSRDKRDNGRVVTVEQWDGDRYGFVTVRSVRKSHIRALLFVRGYDLIDHDRAAAREQEASA